MSDDKSPDNSPQPASPLISAELERALFATFWKWLAVVGSIVIAAVTAISVLVSQTLLLTAKSAGEQAAQRELDQLSNKIAAIDSRSVDVATKAALAEKDSETAAQSAAAQAKRAEATVAQLNALLDTHKAILDSNEQIQSLVELLKNNPDFAKAVSASLTDRLKFSIIKSPFQVQDITLQCPTGSTIVSAACVGNNGSLQAAVGPDFHDDGSITCYRYGGQIMPVQATAVCFSFKP